MEQKKSDSAPGRGSAPGPGPCTGPSSATTCYVPPRHLQYANTQKSARGVLSAFGSSSCMRAGVLLATERCQGQTRRASPPLTLGSRGFVSQSPTACRIETDRRASPVLHACRFLCSCFTRFSCSSGRNEFLDGHSPSENSTQHSGLSFN